VRFFPTNIGGCFLLEPELVEDSRGFFARTWCADEFRAHGLPERLVQSSISFNRKAGTVRGMHFQLPPSREGKLVRCTRGGILDVAVDLRSYSDSFLHHVSERLDERNRRALYIPPGCAHGFQTLTDDTEVAYQMTDVYVADLGCGFRWDDPAFGIKWPLKSVTILPRDAEYAAFMPESVRGLKWD